MDVQVYRYQGTNLEWMQDLYLHRVGHPQQKLGPKAKDMHQMNSE